MLGVDGVIDDTTTGGVLEVARLEVRRLHRIP
jgi:hypothetical protein